LAEQEKKASGKKEAVGVPDRTRQKKKKKDAENFKKESGNNSQGTRSRSRRGLSCEKTDGEGRFCRKKSRRKLTNSRKGEVWGEEM